jgi:hypothetical protein
MLRGLADGSVDVIPDHAPHHYDEKQVGSTRALRHHRPRDRPVALLRSARAPRDRVAVQVDRAAGREPARILGVPGSLSAGAPADITISRRPAGDGVGSPWSKSRNTPFDGWQHRNGVAATIVDGRTVYPERRIHEFEYEGQRDKQGELRAGQRSPALRRVDDQRPFRLARAPAASISMPINSSVSSTIWRFAQDLIDVLPGTLLERVEMVAGRDRRRPVRTIAGLLDSQRSLTHPPCLFAPLNCDRQAGSRCAASPSGDSGQAGTASRRREEYRRHVRALRVAGR